MSEITMTDLKAKLDLEYGKKETLEEVLKKIEEQKTNQTTQESTIAEQTKIIKTLTDKLEAYIKGAEGGHFGDDESIQEAKWLHALVAHKAFEEKAVGDLTDTGTAATIVPSAINKKIVEKIPEYSFVRKVTFQYPTVTEKGFIGAENTGFSVARTAENVAPTPSVAKYSPIEWSLYSLKGSHLISNKLVKVATPNVMNYLWRGFANAYGDNELKEFITGDNANEIMGLDNASLAAITAETGHTAIADLTQKDVLSLIQGLKAGYRKNAVLICSDEFESQLMNLADQSKSNFYDFKTGKIYGKYQVYVDSNVTTSGPTTAVAYFGDFKRFYYFMDDKKMTARATSEGQELVSKDLTYIIVSKYTDGKMVLTEAGKGLKLATP